MFLILSLPRSRSAWLSHFLTLGQGRLVGHDLLLDCDRVEDFEKFFDPRRREGSFEGSCETGAVYGWRLLRHRFPEAKIVCLHRPVLEVVASFLRKGIGVEVALLEERAAQLEACSEAPGVESIEYADLDDRDCLEWLVKHLYGSEAWDFDWWMSMRLLNIQVDMRKRMERLAQRNAALGRLTREVALATAALPKGTVEWMT